MCASPRELGKCSVRNLQLLTERGGEAKAERERRREGGEEGGKRETERDPGVTCKQFLGSQKWKCF